MRPKHRIKPGATYFITTSTWQKRAVFQVERNASLLIETLARYRDAGHFLMYEFVVMPDHLHLVLTPGASISLEKAVQLIKGGSSRAIGQLSGSRFPIWQPGFTEHQIRDLRDFESYVSYIHENPVKAGLCAAPEDYPFSSAADKIVCDPPPVLQGLKPVSLGRIFGGVETPPLRKPQSNMQNTAKAGGQ